MQIIVNGNEFECNSITKGDMLKIAFPLNQSLTKLTKAFEGDLVIDGYENYQDLVAIEKRYLANEVMVSVARTYSDEEYVNEKLKKEISEVIQGLDDNNAEKYISLYPNWEVDKDYEVGYKLQYNEVLYRVIQAHHSQTDWTPDVATSLFARLHAEGGIEVWEQPDSTNPYMTGDRVYYPSKNDTVYESTIDNNVWSPIDYPQGWKVIDND